jgi:SAM-dependent methyltransferase
MGKWSQRVGDVFLDWLAQASGQRWLDVGCGNGAFTELIITRCAPVSVHGVDPSEPQLAYARARSAVQAAQFHLGDALALPFPADMFDVAVMPLVIFFVPDPAKGVAEMRRTVRPGGTVAAYAWDMMGGGFPYATLQAEMRALGLVVPAPPHPEVSRIDVLRSLWADAGLEAIETQAIAVHRMFDDFEDFWLTACGAASLGPTLAAATPEERAHLQARLRACLPIEATGRITCRACANAVKGRVPK